MRRIIGTLAVLAALLVLPSHPAAAQQNEQCFPQTGFCVSGRIRQYWTQNDGLPVFGYPIGPQLEETIEGRTANAPATGRGYAALTVNGATGLYSIDLATGATRRIGSFGAGTGGTSGLVVWSPAVRGVLHLPLVRR